MTKIGKWSVELNPARQLWNEVQLIIAALDLFAAIIAKHFQFVCGRDPKYDELLPKFEEMARCQKLNFRREE
ncbi:MAG: hypothetical protein H6Q76_410 [Firmicutes bacterium]|nr:hypothetical protein [Bacillota bacterium]